MGLSEEHHSRKHNRPFCEDVPVHCHFELVNFTKDQTIRNADQTARYLVFCQRGHLKISCTSFRDEILCVGEVITPAPEIQNRQMEQDDERGRVKR